MMMTSHINCPLLLIISVHLLTHIRQWLGRELYYACDKHGDVRRVRELLKQGADVNWKDNRPLLPGWTSLHRACLVNGADIVKELLKYNPEINHQNDRYANTAVHFACRHGSLDCVKLLLATGQCDLG